MRSMLWRKNLKILQNDFYTIVPLPDNVFVIIIDGEVIGSFIFDSIEEAEDYVIFGGN